MSDTPKLDEKLMEILVCPACHGAVHQEEERVVCASCKRRYPIRENIPIMLVDEAEEG